MLGTAQWIALTAFILMVVANIAYVLWRRRRAHSSPESTKVDPKVSYVLKKYFSSSARQTPQSSAQATSAAVDFGEEYADFVNLLPNGEWASKMDACRNTLSNDQKRMEMSRAFTTLMTEFLTFIQRNAPQCLLNSLELGNFDFATVREQGQQYIGLIVALVLVLVNVSLKADGLNKDDHGLEYDPVKKQVRMKGAVLESVKTHMPSAADRYGLGAEWKTMDYSLPMSEGRMVTILLASEREQYEKRPNTTKTFFECAPCDMTCAMNLGVPVGAPAPESQGGAPAPESQGG